MNELNELSYCELRAKEVINSTDGKRMGRLIDLVFSCETGVVQGIIVPQCKKGFFSKGQDIFIPWGCVQKIGEDVILVTLIMDGCGKMSCCKPGNSQHKHHGDEHRDDHCDCKQKVAAQKSTSTCDGRCEKCMLFDCEQRWKNSKEPIYEHGEQIYIDNKKYN